ncbi:hypothetical protein [Roseobacter sp. A03A-229]
MEVTLRQVADAVWKTRGDRDTDDERQRIYDRARMLRDKGLISSSQPRSQGKTMTFAEADVVAAVVSITASLNGTNWNTIEHLNAELGKKLRAFLPDIKSDRPVFARIDLVTKPWSHVTAVIGGPEVRTQDYAEGSTQFLVWPVTDLVKPVLDLLREG